MWLDVGKQGRKEMHGRRCMENIAVIKLGPVLPI
jgi:hypothetical protein